jgi:hypothetical protein
VADGAGLLNQRARKRLRGFESRRLRHFLHRSMRCKFLRGVTQPGPECHVRNVEAASSNLAAPTNSPARSERDDRHVLEEDYSSLAQR